MSKTPFRVLLVLPVLAALATTPARATDSCGGGCPILPKNARSVSSSPALIPLPAFPAPLVGMTATLHKGKARRILMVEAMVTTAALAIGAPVSPAIYPDVNGIIMEPTTFFGPVAAAMADCSAVFGPPQGMCTVTGTWWLDLDANPALIGVPITVTLSGGDFFGPGIGVPVLATMSVRLQKK